MAAALQEAVAGSVGAVISQLSIYPLDVAKTRLQAQRRRTRGDGSPRTSPKSDAQRESLQRHLQTCMSGQIPYLSPLDCILRVISEEGPMKLFAGLQAACIKQAVTNFIFFYNLRALAPRLRRWPLLQGMAAGLGVQLVVLPIDLIVTRLQSIRHRLSQDSLTVALEIIQKEGFFSLWSGLGPGLLLIFNPGITQLVLKWLGGDSKQASARRAFYSGALAKGVASALTYPYMRAKVQMQVQGTFLGCKKRANLFLILSDILEESGVAGMYDGFALQFTNAVLKDAILTLVRVKILSVVAAFFNLLRRRG
mmetsp:Transcript_34651/g.96739  ORF Transcript_34651/g.96739 Transcript_34651/m.96739 type:complete len:309 (-) Transcript_34651:181-1107(-)